MVIVLVASTCTNCFNSCDVSFVLRKSHAEASFRFQSTYSVCENQGREVFVTLDTTGVLDQRVLVEVRIIGGTATGNKNFLLCKNEFSL